MGQGTLSIYSASAGSGKTYKLTAIYLANLFNSRYNYRRILAVTFTNKATAEMKSRILEHLHKLAEGEESGYLQDLIKVTGRNEASVRAEAKEILNSILHDYSRFSVSTIDSFFQKILRAFVREVGLKSGFSIELDHSAILSAAVDGVLMSAATDKQLKDWLITYAMSNIEEEKSWNLKEGIMRLAEELFKEKFKILSYEQRSKLEDKKFLLDYIGKIRSITYSFEKKLKDFGKSANEIYTQFKLTDDLFYRKSQGVPGFIRSLVAGNIKGPNSYVRELENDPPHWTTGSMSPDLTGAINQGLDKIILTAIHYYDSHIIDYMSALSVLSNIYALGILYDVLHNVRQITTADNSFLLSDAGEVLNLITREDQSSFIYEKVGNSFENFMIDEFQDTSIIQWNNFRPLIENSMAEGYDNLVVGDVKQSIYRWRNSDWRILGTVLNSMIDNKRIFSEPLTTNWRSRSNLILFNNRLFTVIPEQIDKTLEDEKLSGTFRKLYSEAVQSDPGKNNGGYIRLEFITDNDEQKWQDAVLERLPSVIESLQDKGYKASDIGIIVRDGKEGGQVLNRLLGYNNSLIFEGKERYNFNAVSNDSLLLSNSPVVIFIISVITVANDPMDFLSRAIMLRFFLMATGKEDAENVSLVSNKLIEGSKLYFPDGYENFIDSIGKMTLYEATESIIRFFRLGDFSWNVPFLNTFQDYVVSFTGNKNADIPSFLEWWDESGRKKSVVLPGNQEAMRILTIHKSKGLEFKVVILPFLSWNLDHHASSQPVLWVKPDVPPFNELGILPVKYSKELTNTIFAEYYWEEKYSVYLDNINLLYVALTRAKDVLYGFSANNPKSENSISGVLKKAITFIPDSRNSGDLNLESYFSESSGVFEYGEIPENLREISGEKDLLTSKYSVSQSMESLKLKLHGENYFSSESQVIRQKINYGKLMHEVFEGINTSSDISAAVRKLVIEGKLDDEESAYIEKKIFEIIVEPRVSSWFLAGNKVLKEAGILLPSGITRRPDRVIFKDGKTTIIDFKFGEENPKYASQIDLYRSLLIDMGYKNIEGFIWYVDENKIVPA
jgi:ATP-dependent exoDNAse (exonuclease V) beta subunit